MHFALLWAALLVATSATSPPCKDARRCGGNDQQLNTNKTGGVCSQVKFECNDCTCTLLHGKKYVCTGRTCGSASAPKPPPKGYVTLQPFGHFRRGPGPLSWTAARDACQADGAALALPASQEELQVLRSVFTFVVPGADSLELVWFGASDIAEEGKYVTVKGVPMENATSLKWVPGQPEGKRVQNCLCYSNGLHDYKCGGKAAYFCKVDL